jgi:phosphoribosylformylglycinamidine synthase PurS subunit
VTYVARVYVTLKPTVNDPQGLAVRTGLHHLGFESVGAVRMGKYLEVSLDAADEGAAGDQVDRMCRQLLANPVIETYRFEVTATPS